MRWDTRRNGGPRTEREAEVNDPTSVLQKRSHTWADLNGPSETTKCRTRWTRCRGKQLTQFSSLSIHIVYIQVSNDVGGPTDDGFATKILWRYHHGIDYILRGSSPTIGEFCQEGRDLITISSTNFQNVRLISSGLKRKLKKMGTSRNVSFVSWIISTSKR